MDTLRNNILKTLLYYDIFSHPLTSDEIFFLLPQNSLSKSEVRERLRSFSNQKKDIIEKNDFYFIGKNENFINLRKSREYFSRRAWKIVRFFTFIIKQFPFVRAVCVTGSLSKNSSLPESDLDFLVITKPNRLWICRTMLMLFKKIFLFNSYKFFCINYFISEDFLEIEEKNIFTATEIAHIKCTFNSELFKNFLTANTWIKNYFPNYDMNENYFHSPGCKINNSKGFIQELLELPFTGNWGNILDNYLRIKTSNHWKKKYFYLDEGKRRHMFKSTSNVSKTHPGNMQEVILKRYKERLDNFKLELL